MHLFAAGSAAAVSTFAVQPLDVLKTRLQVNHCPHLNPGIRIGIFGSLNGIFKTEGMRGLYRGVFPTLLSVVPSISIYFTMYNEFKQLFGCPTGSPTRDVVRQSIAAGLASCCTSAITNPLWLVKTRLQVQHIDYFARNYTPGKDQPHSKAKYRGTVHTFKSVVREEGFLGLYRGLGASLLASSQAMIQFPLYEMLKKVMIGDNKDNIRYATMSYLASSAIAASLSCMVTYPAEVIRARLQTEGMLPPSQRQPNSANSSIMSSFRTLWAQEGIRGFYRGLGTNLLRLTPSHAISFTAYEFILRFLSEAWEATNDFPSAQVSDPPSEKIVIVDPPSSPGEKMVKASHSAVYKAATFIG